MHCLYQARDPASCSIMGRKPCYTPFTACDGGIALQERPSLQAHACMFVFCSRPFPLQSLVHPKSLTRQSFFFEVSCMSRTSDILSPRDMSGSQGSLSGACFHLGHSILLLPLRYSHKPHIHLSCLRNSLTSCKLQELTNFSI